MKVIIPETEFVKAAAIFMQENYGKIPKKVEDAVIPIVGANDFPGTPKELRL